MNKFKEGDYIVYLGVDKKGTKTYNDCIPPNHVFKFLEYQSNSKKWIIGEWLNNNRYSGPPTKDFRLATPKEISLYKRFDKPVNINLLGNIQYEIY